MDMDSDSAACSTHVSHHNLSLFGFTPANNGYLDVVELGHNWFLYVEQHEQPTKRWHINNL